MGFEPVQPTCKRPRACVNCGDKCSCATYWRMLAHTVQWHMGQDQLGRGKNPARQASAQGPCTIQGPGVGAQGPVALQYPRAMTFFHPYEDMRRPMRHSSRALVALGWRGLDEEGAGQPPCAHSIPKRQGRLCVRALHRGGQKSWPSGTAGQQGPEPRHQGPEPDTRALSQGC